MLSVSCLTFYFDHCTLTMRSYHVQYSATLIVFCRQIRKRFLKNLIVSVTPYIRLSEYSPPPPLQPSSTPNTLYIWYTNKRGAGRGGNDGEKNAAKGIVGGTRISAVHHAARGCFTEVT